MFFFNSKHKNFKSPVKNSGRQRRTGAFNSGLKVLNFVKPAFASYELQASLLNSFCISEYRQRDLQPLFMYYEYDDGHIGTSNVIYVNIHVCVCVCVCFTDVCRGTWHNLFIFHFLI